MSVQLSPPAAPRLPPSPTVRLTHGTAPRPDRGGAASGSRRPTVGPAPSPRLTRYRDFVAAIVPVRRGWAPPATVEPRERAVRSPAPPAISLADRRPRSARPPPSRPPAGAPHPARARC